MDNNERVELLEEIVDYLPLLIETSEEVCQEFRGAQEEDTKELFNQVVDGINWSLGMYVEISESMDEDTTTINNEELDDIIDEFAKAIENKEEEAIAEIMEKGILPFLREFCRVAQEELQE